MVRKVPILCTVASLLFSLKAATPLVTQYIAPVDNPTWENRVLTAEYGTGAGFKYTVCKSTWDGKTWYNFFILVQDQGNDHPYFRAWSNWLRFTLNGDSHDLADNYTWNRSAASRERFLYQANFKSTGGFESANDHHKTIAIGAGTINQVFDENGDDTTSSGAAYVQCVHTDWVYRVAFDANGGSGTMGDFVFTNSAALPANAFTRAGYGFTGWNTAADASGATYANKAGVARDLTLYAQWKAKSYTVTFDANGGTTSTSSKTVTYDATYGTLPEPVRTGYSFGGWFTAASGGSKVTASSTVAITAAQTLYAHWTANTYAITLNRQGGSGGDSTVTATYDAAMPAIAVPTRAGYTFGGFYAETGGEGTQYYTASGKSACKWNKTSTTTLYAKWTPKSYTVNFNANGGTASVASKTVTYDATYGELPAPTRTGYSFNGWFTAESGGLKVTDSSKVAIAAEHTLYAQWTVNTYTITLNRQSGSGGDSFATAAYGAAMPVIEVPTRTGYTFGGYYTNADGGGTQYYKASGTSARKWDKTVATTLYAKWTANSYAVTFNANGGTTPTSSKTVTYDAVYGTLPAPTRTGYSFGGWFTSASGGSKVTESATVSITAAQTLYAHWTANSYTVTFNANGGTTPTSSKTVTYDAVYGALPTPTRAGYSFGGWFTAASGGSKVTESDTASITAAQTLFAHWSANNYTITFNANGGTTPTSSKTVTYDATYGALPTPTREGYSFGGWFTAASGGSKVTASSNVSITVAQTLYAHWTGKAYEILFDNDFSWNAYIKTASYSATKGTLTKNWVTLTTGADEAYSSTSRGTGDGYYCIAVGETEYIFTCSIDKLGDNTSIGNMIVYYVAHKADKTVMLDGSRDYRRITNSATEGDRYYGTFTPPAGTKYIQIFFHLQGAGKTGRFVAPCIYKSDPYGKTSLTRGNHRKTFAFSDASNATFESCLNSGNTWPTVTRTGYSFTGWFTAESSGGATYSKTSKPVAGDLRLWSRWTVNTYTITLNRQSGSGGDSSATATYDAAMPEIEVPTRTGYTFGGYYTGTGGGGTQYYTASGTRARKWDKTVATTLYAKWTANSYTVTFDANGGTTPTSSKTVTYDATYGALPTPVRTGYSFGGWFTSASGGAEVTESTKVSITAAQTLYAHWSANTYTVTFDANGGSVSPTSRSVTFGGKYSLPTPTRTGYAFTGWYTSTDSGAQLVDSDTIATATMDHALYAHWSPNSYEVEFMANGGNGEMAGEPFKYDEMKPLSSNQYARTGYTFAGWSQRADGTGFVYANGAVVSNLSSRADAVVNLYACWVAEKTAISFDKAGGEGGADSVEATYDTRLPTAEVPVRTGYEFLGYWFGNDQYYYSSGEGRLTWNVADAAATLVARWQPKSYTVYFNPNGGGNASFSSKSVTYAEEYGELAAATRTGYDFDAWYTAVNGGAKVSSATVMNVASNHTLYAHWKAASYKVTFDRNGSGSFADSGEVLNKDGNAERSFEYNGTYGEFPSVVWIKHELLGWFTAASGGMQVNESDTVSITAPTVFYAHWQDNTMPVNFDASGDVPDGEEGTGFITDQDFAKNGSLYRRTDYYEKGAPYGYLPMPTNSNTRLFFAGWWSSADRTNRVQVLASDKVDTSRQTLYARWKVIPSNATCTLTFKFADGRESTNVTATVGDEFGKWFLNPAPEYAGGYSHFGWYRKNGSRVQDTDIIEGDETLDGRWTLRAFNDAWNCQEIAFSTNGVSGWTIDAKTHIAQSGDLIKDYMSQENHLNMVVDKPGLLSGVWDICQIAESDFGNAGKGWISLNFKSSGYVSEHLNGGTSQSGWTIFTKSMEPSEQYSIYYRREKAAEYDGFDDCGWVKDVQFTPAAATTSIDDWESFASVASSVRGAVWTTGGAEPWATVETNKEWAAAGSIADGRSSWVRLDIPPAKGVLEFKWRVSGETGYTDTNGVYQACDYLEFSDGSGSTGPLRTEGSTNGFETVVWTNNTESAHSFKWRYVKDGDTRAGEDGALLKDVKWTPLRPQPFLFFIK